MAILEDGTDTYDMPLFGTDSATLNDLLTNGNLSPEASTLAKQVGTMEGKIAEAGYNPDSAVPRESLFHLGLRLLNAPGAGIRGVIDEAVHGNMFGTDPKTGENVGTGFVRGIERNTTTEDILRREHLISNPFVRGAAGIAGDILTDPLTYLTFGGGTTKNLATAGLKPLTEEGLALSKLASERLAAGGITDAVAQGTRIDDIFRGISKYQDAESLFKDATDPTVKALYADEMEKAQALMGDHITPSDIAGVEVFKKPALVKVSAKIPGLGNLQDDSGIVKATEVLHEDPGIVGSALRAAGKAFKPGEVGGLELHLKDIPAPVLNAFDNIRLYTNEALSKFAGAVAKASEVPILGAPVKLATSIAKGAMDTISEAGSQLKKIFNEAAITGPEFHDAKLLYGEQVQDGRRLAMMKTIDTLGEHLGDKETQRAAAEAIDAMAHDSLEKTIPITGTPQDEKALALFNRLKDANQVSEGDQLLTRDLVTSTGAEQEFGSRIQNLLADPNVDSRVKDLVSRTVKAMDGISAEEAQAGIGYTRLEYYLTHRYKNAGLAEDAVNKYPKSFANFTKERRYATLSDAFKAKGYVGDTDLSSLLQYRFERSYQLQAQRRFFNRLTVEHGLNPEIVSGLYRQAILDPSGEAAQALQRYKIPYKALNPDLMAEGSALTERQALWKRIGEGDTEASAMLKDMKADARQKIHQELWAAGKPPLNWKAPAPELGEIGELVKTPKGEQVFLPKPIADAYHETIAAKDLLKSSSFGQGQFGKAIIGAFDTASSFWKRFTTVPFIAHWARHGFGSRFLEAMDSIHNMDPGVFARTMSVLSGKSSIISPAGQILDKPTLERVINQFGLHYTAGDMLGTIQSVSDMNVEKYIAMKNPLSKNLAGITNGPMRQALLEQAQNKMMNSFDGFQRVNHFIHRFEQGDSIPAAARSAQELYYNYRDMSDVEKSYFRRFYTFYGFMSKTVKRTVTDLVTRPGAITGQVHLVNGMAEVLSDPNAAPTADEYDNRLLKSVVASEQLSARIGTNAEGHPIIGRGFGAPLNHVLEQYSLQMPKHFTVSELLGAAADSATRTVQKQFAAANPFINAAAQKFTGKNLYFDKPLDSKFLRKLPDLTEAAKTLAGYAHTDLPIIINDTVKEFLDAVPDGKGRMVADPTKMWLLTNIIPGFARAVSMGGAMTNQDIPSSSAWIRGLTGINIDDSDASRTMLATVADADRKFMNAKSIKERLDQEREEP